ncbi:DUF1854 domain-containing protein [bacterium]|nr:MAG: DUF1854 domain-containing protein [bacterium]
MKLKIFHEPKDRLRLTVDDNESYPTVKPVWAAPLSRPDHFLSLVNGKGDEIVNLPDVSVLDDASRASVREELSRRYLSSRVLEILEARSEFGATYWTVETERGQREFVTQNLQENAQWLSPGHLMLIDVDGNRFELKDVDSLDAKSRAHLARTI